MLQRQNKLRHSLAHCLAVMAKLWLFFLLSKRRFQTEDFGDA